ncbi:MAG: DUF1549 and DUF1553 domain-containing protein [Pirellulaceae bacterium]
MTLEETPVPAGVEISGIQIEPVAIELTTPIAYSQLLTTSHTPLGETVDLTRAHYRVEPPIAEVDSTGLVRPVADGTAELVATYGDQETRIPLTISGVTAEYHPSFVRDVQPVLSRLGCQPRDVPRRERMAGWLQAFLAWLRRLYDFRALTDEIGARRFNRVAPDQSLMLLKASGSSPHVGGVLTRPGEPYYEILRQWIADGVPFDLDTSPRVTSISVAPQLPVLPRAGMQLQMRVMATYSDGAVRDVTREAFVEGGNIEVLSSLPGGRLNTLRRGEAAVLVRYEGSYAATTLTVMGDRTGFEWVQQPIYDSIDELVDHKLERMRIQAAPLCTDEEFVRRLYLDLTGLPPTADNVRDFLNDPAPSREKREVLIDRLVGSPEYVEYWTNKWADLLQVNRKFLGEEGSVVLRNWIHDSIASNKPYDQFAREVLTAEGSNLANPPAAYWKVLRDPSAAMENTTHLFLAIRFNCNKCHDHPFERWTQDQYYEMAAYFAQVGRKEDPAYTGQRIGGSAVEGAVPLVEIVFDSGNGEVVHDRTGQQTPPSFPYEHVGFVSTSSGSRRQMLASWLTSADNPYFARSYVNRMWGYLTGVGIIEPIDDIRAGNPPTNEELLAYLEGDFIEHGFDVDHLVRKICKSRTYQLSIRTNDWNSDDSINYSHALPRRLPAEVLFDSFHFAAGAPFRIPGAPEGIRAAELPDAGVSVPFLDDFGRPVRESACECERSSGVALGPVMKLVNGSSLANAISNPQNDLARLAREIQDDEQLIEELFLRFLARYPTDREKELALETLRLPGSDLLNEKPNSLGSKPQSRQRIGKPLNSWERGMATMESRDDQRTSGATFEKWDDGLVWVTGGRTFIICPLRFPLMD